MKIPHKGISPKCKDRVFIAKGAVIIGDVNLAKDSSIWFNCVLRGDANYIKVGERTNIQDLSMVHIWHRKYGENGELIDEGYPCIIGDDVTIGHSCVIHACTIKNRCLIGMGAIIMDGVVIEEDSIVGAGAVVTKGKSFAPRSLILGNPAKFIRELKDDEIEEIKNSALRYARFKDDFLDD